VENKRGGKKGEMQKGATKREERAHRQRLPYRETPWLTQKLMNTTTK